MKKIINNNNIITTPAVEFPFTKGIGPTIYEKMKEIENLVAQIDGITGEKETYAAVLKRCVRTALAMSAKGITSDDIVTVCSGNHFDTCVPIIASFFLNVKLANMDPRLPEMQTAYLLDQVRPKMIFVSTDAVDLMENSLRAIGTTAEIVVFGETSKHTKFSEFLVESDKEEFFKPVNVDDLTKTAIIIFSSGTTSLPKGICLNHKTLFSMKIRAISEYFYPNSVYLSASSVYWVSYIISLIKCIFNETSRLIVPHMNTANMWQLITKYKVNMLVTSTSAVAAMCQSVRPMDADSSSLKLLRFGGGSCTSQIMTTARKLLPTTDIHNSYGLTATGGGCTDFWPTNEHERKTALTKTNSCGQPLPGFSFKVVDTETGDTLGLNQKGEIRIKSEFQMNGYFNINTSDRWDEDGFLKTGDIGYIDEDYYVHIVDRIKDMFKFQNFQISPVKLEQVLMTHPAVESAVVVGIPHPVDDSHAMGIVMLRKSHVGILNVDEIRKFVDDQVGDIYKLRGGVKIVDKFEKSPSGKITKQHIKKLVLAGEI